MKLVDLLAESTAGMKVAWTVGASAELMVV